MDCCICSTVYMFRPPRNTICATCYEGAKNLLNMLKESETCSKGLGINEVKPNSSKASSAFIFFLICFVSSIHGCLAVTCCSLCYIIVWFLWLLNWHHLLLIRMHKTTIVFEAFFFFLDLNTFCWKKGYGLILAGFNGYTYTFSTVKKISTKTEQHSLTTKIPDGLSSLWANQIISHFPMGP